MRPRLAGSTRPAHRPPGQAGRRKVQGCAPGHVLSSGLRRLSPLSPVGAQVYGERVPGSRWSWAALARPVTASDDLPLPDVTDSHVGREWTIDSAAVVLALALGALFLSPELHDTPDPLAAGQIAVDVDGGPAGVLVPVVATAVADRRGARVSVSWARSRSRPPRRVCWRCPRWPCTARPEPAVLVTVLWVPSVLAFAVYSPTTDPAAVLLLVMPSGLGRHRLGHVHPSPSAAAAVLAGTSAAGRSRPAPARGARADGRTDPDRPRDARRPGPPDLADRAARRWARGATGPARRRRSGRPPTCSAPRLVRHSRSCAA